MVVCVLLSAFGVTRADVIELLDGTKIEGTIQELSEESVALSTESPKGSGIFLEQRFPRTQVKHIEKKDAESADFETIRSLEIPQTADETQVYDEILQNKIAPFLMKYPQGKFTADVNALRAKLETERERIMAGECKVSGVWMTRQHIEEDPEISAAIHLARMQRAQSAISAMIAFDALEKKHATSSSYPAAVEVARVKLDRIPAEISRAKLDLAQKLGERERGLQLASANSRVVMEKGIADESSATKAAISQAKQEGRKWLPLLPDAKLLDDLAKLSDSEKARLNKIDTMKMSGAVDTARTAKQQLDAGDLAGAKASLDEAQKLWPKYAVLASLKESLRKAQEEAARRAKEEEKSSGS
jgi:hypothetical protein